MLFSGLKAPSLKKKKSRWKQNRYFPTEGPRREALWGCYHEYTSTWGCKTRLQLSLKAVADKANAAAMKLSPAIFDWCLDGVISEASLLRAQNRLTHFLVAKMKSTEGMSNSRAADLHYF